MNDYYEFSGITLETGALGFNDNHCSITFNYESMQKTVRASLYLTFEDMPFPLNEIYDRLWGIALKTHFVISEVIQ